MIQPLRTSKTTWLVYWLDLEEPVPVGRDYFLPTLLVVCDNAGAPLSSPEILEELDQSRVEGFLLKLFEKLGAPDRVDICASEEWDEEAWRAFSQENHIDIRFRVFEQLEELRSLAKTVILRFAPDKPDLQMRGKEIARGLVNTALRTRSIPKKLALLRAAIARDPDCSAARVEIGDMEFQSGGWKACLAAYDEVVTREFPRWQGGRVDWWTDRETRPYLRAIYGRAMTYWHQGRHAEAAAQFEHLLTLNPKDNQGVRFFIPLLHSLAEDYDAASAYYAHYETAYPHDYSEPSLLFGSGLNLFQEGRENEAKDRYRLAILKNIYIAPMLLELPEPTRLLWHPNDRAEPAYAGEFIDSYAVLWDRESGALRLLREAWEEAQPLVDRIVAHRENMTDFQDQRYEPEYKKLWQSLVEADDRLTAGGTE